MITVKGTARKLRLEHGAEVVMVIAASDIPATGETYPVELDISATGLPVDELASILENAAKGLRDGALAQGSN